MRYQYNDTYWKEIKNKKKYIKWEKKRSSGVEKKAEKNYDLG